MWWNFSSVDEILVSLKWWIKKTQSDSSMEGSESTPPRITHTDSHVKSCCDAQELIPPQLTQKKCVKGKWNTGDPDVYLLVFYANSRIFNKCGLFYIYIFYSSVVTPWPKHTRLWHTTCSWRGWNAFQWQYQLVVIWLLEVRS